MRKLKVSEIPALRAELLDKQNGVCLLCGQAPQVPVLDHCHAEGHIRGVLCRGCNSLLGVIENNRKRYGLASMIRLARFLSSLPQYVMHSRHDYLHPTFKTEEEKRAQRNRKARTRRAAAQATDYRPDL